MHKRSASSRWFVAMLFMLGSVLILNQAMALEIFGNKPGKKLYTPRLKGAVTVAGDYSDNVNTSPGRNSKGMRLRVTPEFNVEMPNLLSQTFGTNKLFVDGGYRYGYMGVDGTKVDFHRNAHTANAGLRYKVNSKSSLGSTYVFQRDQYPFASAGDTYTLNDIGVSLAMQWTQRLTLEPFYSFQNFNDTGLDGTASTSVLSDYGDHKVGWSSRYKLSPKAAFVGRSEYENKSFRDLNTKSFWSYGGKGGLELDITKKINITGMGGYKKRYFDEGKDLGSWLWDGRLNYAPSRKLQTSLYYNYDLTDTFVTGFLHADPGYVGSPGVVDYIPRNYRAIRVQRTGVNISYALTDADRIGTGFVYQWSRANSGQFIGTGTAAKLDENDYQFNVDYAHAFNKWLNLTLGYANLGRNTNVSDNFRANVLSFGLRIGW